MDFIDPFLADRTGGLAALAADDRPMNAVEADLRRRVIDALAELSTAPEIIERAQAQRKRRGKA